MKKIRYEYPIRMWCDVMAVAVPLFAIGIVGSVGESLWLSIGIFVIGLVGALVSLYHLLTEKPLQETPVSKDISMAATYVWPCIFGGLIADHYGSDGIPFYVMAAVVMGVVLLVNHNDLM